MAGRTPCRPCWVTGLSVTFNLFPAAVPALLAGLFAIAVFGAGAAAVAILRDLAAVPGGFMAELGRDDVRSEEVSRCLFEFHE